MPFGSLWLPVLVSGAAVWIASAVAWMVLPHHRSDFKGLADETPVADALRKQALPPGEYRVPYCADMKQMKDPAFLKKFDDGPVALIVLAKSERPAMGKSLVLYLAYTIFVSFVVGYVLRHTLQVGSIWMGRPWPHTMKNVVDAVAYGLITGAIFCSLWPKG